MTTLSVYHISPLKAFLLFIVIDVFLMGVGMGIPIFNIAFGFIVGWYLIKWFNRSPAETPDILKRLLMYSGTTAGVTFLGMLLIWGWWATSVFDPQADYSRTGIPMILFEPRASFVAWLILMIVISPFLQLLTTTFAGIVALLALAKHRQGMHVQSVPSH